MVDETGTAGGRLPFRRYGGTQGTLVGRILLSLTAGLVAASIAFGATADDGSRPDRFEASVQQGRVTLIGNAAPLGAVVLRIAREARLKVLVRGDLSRPVTERFADLPLDLALRQLLQDVPHAMVLRADAADRDRVAVLYILGGDSGESGRSEGGAGRAGAPVTDSGHDLVVLRQEIDRGLRSADRDSRLQALQKARVLDRAAASDVLRRVLEGDQDPTLRGYAVRELTRLGGRDALATLERGLADPEPEVRAQVIAALAALGGAAGAALLNDVALSDPHRSVRQAARRALSAGHRD